MRSENLKIRLMGWGLLLTFPISIPFLVLRYHWDDVEECWEECITAVKGGYDE